MSPNDRRLEATRRYIVARDEYEAAIKRGLRYEASIFAQDMREAFTEALRAMDEIMAAKLARG